MNDSIIKLNILDKDEKNYYEGGGIILLKQSDELGTIIRKSQHALDYNSLIENLNDASTSYTDSTSNSTK